MKKPLKTAAWAAIWSIVIGVLSGIVSLTFGTSSLGMGLGVVFTIVGGIFGALFVYGFVILGKKFDAPLLQVMAWIGIGIVIGWAVLSLTLSVATIVSAQGSVDFSNQELPSLTLLVLFLIFWIPFSLLFGAYNVLFGVGLLKLKDKVEYAKTAAVLDIVGGATMIIFVGIAISLVAYVFKIMLMFKAAKKYS